jgi:hypothetical protein
MEPRYLCIAGKPCVIILRPLTWNFKINQAWRDSYSLAKMQDYGVCLNFTFTLFRKLLRLSQDKIFHLFFACLFGCFF